MEPEDAIDTEEAEEAVNSRHPPARYEKLKWNSESLTRPWRVNQITSLCKLVSVSLGLLCVLLLTAVISLSVRYVEHRTSYENLTNERDHLRTSYHQLQTSHDRLQTSQDQLQTSHDQLQTSYAQLVSEQQLSSASGGCPHEWTRFEDSCYDTFNEENPTWNECQKYCMKNGLDLVIINSIEEQDFLNTLGLPSFWIGLTDSESEGSWRWVDGSRPTVTFWREDEPNNADDWGEDCAAFNFYRGRYRESWNDLPCRNHNHCVCEGAYKVP